MVLVFDLDDTLYPEISYVHSGFRAVANAMKIQHGWDETKSVAQMIEALTTHGRGAVFDSLLAANGRLSRKNVRECVAIYRKHEPRIRLAPESIDFLNRWPVQPYLVTDGNKIVQEKKISALNLWDRFKRILITHRYGLRHAKPSSYCFDLIRRHENCGWSDLVYVGDNPAKDFVSLNELGCRTIRVLTGAHRSISAKPGHDGQYHIKSLSSLEELLRNIN